MAGPVIRNRPGPVGVLAARRSGMLGGARCPSEMPPKTSKLSLVFGLMGLSVATGCGLLLDTPLPSASDGGFGDAGDSGDGSGCVDADGDGVTDCALDCDDSDPLTYPGAPETCGDMVRNDCTMGVVDEGCGGAGTYVAPWGDNSNPGTMIAPVATIAQGMANAMSLGAPEVFVGAAVDGTAADYVEDIVMVDGISLVGGFDSLTWTRDDTKITRIISLVPEGLFFPPGLSPTTRLEGFQVENRSSGAGVFATITIEEDSSPVVVGNAIFGPINDSGRSIAITVNPRSALSSGAPRIADNEIFLGTGEDGSTRDSGALGLRSVGARMQVVGNRVDLSDDRAFQWGIAVYDAPGDSLIQDNVVRGTGVVQRGFGIQVSPSRNQSSFLQVDTNDVDPGECAQGCSGLWVGAVEPDVMGLTQRVTITNNVVFGGSGPVSIGLRIAFEETISVAPDVLVHSNFIRGMGRATSRVGMSVGVLLGARTSTRIQMGELYNNIIYSGLGEARFALFEFTTNMDPLVLHANAFWVEDGSSAVVSAAYADEGDFSAVPSPPFIALNSASAINTLTDLGASAVLGNITDHCRVIDPVPDGDAHLMTPSACVDAGVATRAPMLDFDGEMRPNGGVHDIGADET